MNKLNLLDINIDIYINRHIYNRGAKMKIYFINIYDKTNH